MVAISGFQKLIHLMTVLLVASILPLSCIVHCRVNSPNPSASTELFVCHPFDRINAETPQHLNAHTVVLRATHEVAILLVCVLALMMPRSTLVIYQYTYNNWLHIPLTPPPRSLRRA